MSLSANVLRLRYSPEDAYHGELQATVESRGFSGQGSAWFPTEAIEHFCDQLGQYPLADDNLPALEGGYWKNDTISELHLSIRVTKQDSLGRLRVTAALCDADGSQVHTWLPTGYEDLSQFQLSIRKMLKGVATEATLEGVWP